jgi:endo-1,4-beta-D-glucanase Y
MKFISSVFFPLVIFILSGISDAQEIKRPYPQHTVYNKSTIKPKSHSQAEMDKVVIDYYNRWKRAYVRNDCSDPKEYYVWDNEDIENDNEHRSICVSEGQGYGMLITVIMAGTDKEAKTIYDGMYKFYKAHRSRRSEYLMSWSILNGCVTNTKNGNQSSATDGDFDIALSLLMAGEQWGNNGIINYQSEAIKMIDAILKYEINHVRNTVLLSDANINGDPDFYDIRSSDFMPVHLKIFNKYLPDKMWLAVLNQMYVIIQTVQDNYSQDTGLVPDFIVFRDGKYMPAKGNYLESKYDGDFYFNACRLPMRVALDKIIYGDSKADSLLDSFNDWIQESTSNIAESINSGYHLNGQKIGKSVNTIPSFVGPIAVSAMMDPENQEWLNDLWDFITKEFEFDDYKYYDNTLKMLSLLILSGNYWTP